MAQRICIRLLLLQMERWLALVHFARHCCCLAKFKAIAVAIGSDAACRAKPCCPCFSLQLHVPAINDFLTGSRIHVSWKLCIRLRRRGSAMGHRSTGALAVSRYPFPARLMLTVRKEAVFMLILIGQCRLVLQNMGRTENLGCMKFRAYVHADYCKLHQNLRRFKCWSSMKRCQWHLRRNNRFVVLEALWLVFPLA